MRRRTVEEPNGAPLQLRRYVAEEWDGPQAWYDALNEYYELTGEHVEIDEDSEWPDVPFSAEDV